MFSFIMVFSSKIIYGSPGADLFHVDLIQAVYVHSPAPAAGLPGYSVIHDTHAGINDHPPVGLCPFRFHLADDLAYDAEHPEDLLLFIRVIMPDAHSMVDILHGLPFTGQVIRGAKLLDIVKRMHDISRRKLRLIDRMGGVLCLQPLYELHPVFFHW